MRDPDHQVEATSRIDAGCFYYCRKHGTGIDNRRGGQTASHAMTDRTYSSPHLGQHWPALYFRAPKQGYVWSIRA